MTHSETTPTSETGSRKVAYHHGDLRAALLVAAEEELAEKGIEGFTLRGCAKRAGVSHAAPAHHFRDSNALLTELAAVGFRKFLETQCRRQSQSPGDPRAQLVAAGLGYIEFALANPELFKLLFSSKRADFEDPILAEAAHAAFEHLVASVDAVSGRARREDIAATVDVMAVWSTAHGLADLLMNGRMKSIIELDDDHRRQALGAIFERALPPLDEPHPA